MHRLTLSLPHHHYDIFVGSGLLSRTVELLAPVLPSRRCIIVADASIAASYAPPIEASLAQAGIAHQRLIIASGEQSKSMQGLGTLLGQLLALQPDRHTTLIALGGGVTGDVCGFAASILLRGVPFIQIPTTLLSMVDSSVGGKTGINMQAGKNLVGSFHQPLAVISDTDTLQSLPAREVRAGYAEIAKMGAVSDADFFAWLETHAQEVLALQPDALQHAILTSCEGKARIVAADEKEKDQRALLNFGHTFGHALEAEHHYGDALRHGEAVAVGMVMAARLSARLGLCHADVQTRLAAHLAAVGLPTMLADIPSPDRGWHADVIAKHFFADKKTAHGKLNFVLLNAIGQGTIARDVSPEDATAAIA